MLWDLGKRESLSAHLWFYYESFTMVMDDDQEARAR